MIRLIYTSRSLEPLPKDLKDIITTSSRNNRRLDITGALCFLDGVYFQYLEGEAVVLEDLYRRILADPRHHDARLLERKRITTRIFGPWSMALVTWTEQTRAIFQTYNADTQVDLHALAGESAARTFEAQSRSTNWLKVGT